MPTKNSNPSKSDDIVFFSGSSHPELGKEIAKHLGVHLGKMELETFPDGEMHAQILETVSGRDVVVLQTIALKPNDYLMELLIIVDALKRASAKSIIAVIPYFGYSRQDRRDKPRVPITARLVADLLEKAGVTRVLTMDLHAGQIQGFFNIPVDNLLVRQEMLAALKSYGLKDLIVVAPDIGSVKIARPFASSLGVDFAVVDKHRSNATDVEAVSVIGDVAGKDVLLADDMCSTGGTLVAAAKACQEKGARRIFASVTHGLFVGNAVEKIEKSPIEALLMSNSIPVTDRFAGSSKFKTVSVASLLSQAIHCMISAESLSSLLDAD